MFVACQDAYIQNQSSVEQESATSAWQATQILRDSPELALSWLQRKHLAYERAQRARLCLLLQEAQEERHCVPLRVERLPVHCAGPDQVLHSMQKAGHHILAAVLVLSCSTFRNSMLISHPGDEALHEAAALLCQLLHE